MAVTGLSHIAAAMPPGAASRASLTPMGQPKARSMAETGEYRPFNVLFLCHGNSARSIMAEAILNRAGTERFRAFSAGSQPRGELHPFAVDALKSGNYATDELRSKDWAEFAGTDAPQMDFVITVCDTVKGETCPVWPGQPMTTHWGMPDPVAVEGTEAERRVAFAETMRHLHNRIDIFVNLPMQSLDRLALQNRLDAISSASTAAATGG